MNARRFKGGLAIAIGLAASAAQAGQIDLTLDVEFVGGVSSAGGTWRLFAATDGEGLSSLDVTLSGIDPAVTNELPSGSVNANPGPNAGFSIFVDLPVGNGATRIIAAQSATVPGAGDQGIFYGVGTLENGSPDFAGRPPGTNAIGPTFSTLDGLVNSPWATLGTPSATSALVASGSFTPGTRPGFGPTDGFEGFVFTSIGTNTVPGVDEAAGVFTTTLITNRVLGVADGDYNLDGIVNAADYTVWRDTLGDVVDSLTGADGDGDGVITQDDYDVWVVNFGEVGMPAPAVAVPEPAGMASALLLSALLARWDPKKRNKRTQSLDTQSLQNHILGS